MAVLDKRVSLYCDGGARPIGSLVTTREWRGAWGVVMVINDTLELELSGPFTPPNPTNNRAELFAAIQGLKRAPSDASEIILHTDSQYVVYGASLWLPRWLKNGWRTAQNRRVENRDLWERLLEVASQLPVSWAWIPRDSCPYQQRADELAAREFGL